MKVILNMHFPVLNLEISFLVLISQYSELATAKKKKQDILYSFKYTLIKGF